MQGLGRRLVTALAESSDLLDVAEQLATALEDLARGDQGDILQAGHHAPGAGPYALQPHLRAALIASSDHSIGMLSDHSGETGDTPNELAHQGADVITLRARHSTQQVTLHNSVIELCPDTDSGRSLDQVLGPGSHPPVKVTLHERGETETALDQSTPKKMHHLIQ